MGRERGAGKEGWIVLLFSLPTKEASGRVEVWRRLKRYGAAALPGAGYALPNTSENRERFEWLTATIRRYNGGASLLEVLSAGGPTDEELRRTFIDARTRDYTELLKQVRALKGGVGGSDEAARLRKRFQEIKEIDFFPNALRTRIERMLDEQGGPMGTKLAHARMKAARFRGKTWVTRPRPAIDRVASAWLIRNFIDPKAKFAFGNSPDEAPGAIPFDMFQKAGFGHSGDNCTFETLVSEFNLREPRLKALAEMVHDADLADGKFGRTEATGVHRILKGWAAQGMKDEELLKRGMELIEGLYAALVAK